MTVPATTLAARVIADVGALQVRATIAEQDFAAACAELQLILDALPYENAKSGKNVKLRKRLTRFLGERLRGI